jgi:LPS sulfotransferase NodH
MRESLNAARTVAEERNAFLVLTTQRTGSSWLMDRLSRIPGVEGHMELFYHDIRRAPPRAGSNDVPRFVESRLATASGRRPGAVWRYLDSLYSRPGRVGFKLMYSQLRQYPEILPYLIVRHMPIVHLVRNNSLDVVISEQLANVTGESHRTRNDPTVPATIRLPLDSLVTRIRQLERHKRWIRMLLSLLPNPGMEISYERLCSSPEALLPVLEFIGLRSAPVDSSPESSLVKRQRAPHARVLANYAEVSACLSRAGLTHLLH